nr:flagellar hook-basal body complex protein [uncultured Bacillus sp.]
MLRSMYSGISGMKNFQTKLDVIGNNIANVNTFGYKKGRVTFKDMISQTVAGASAATNGRGGKNPMQIGLGATLATIDTIHTSTSLQSTGRSLDLGIDGDGYFIVRQGGANLYTRAGNFYLDDMGTLVNADGLKVQAFQYDAAGNRTNQLGDVVINVNAVLPAITTDTIKLAGNLSDKTIAGEEHRYTQQIKIVGADGKPQNVEVVFEKTGDNAWDVTTIPASTVNPSITIDFTSGTAVTTPTTATWNFGGKDISLDFSNLTQTESETTAYLDPNGNETGKLESFNIGAQGEINGVYSNGKITVLGQIALAKFSNSSGLTKAANNLFQESINSGTADIAAAGEGRGVLAAGSLEMSNVDLSEEFTEMITAQRGFQANTRIITTSDEILQELVNLKR